MQEKPAKQGSSNVPGRQDSCDSRKIKFVADRGHHRPRECDAARSHLPLSASIDFYVAVCRLPAAFRDWRLETLRAGPDVRTIGARFHLGSAAEIQGPIRDVLLPVRS